MCMGRVCVGVGVGIGVGVDVVFIPMWCICSMIEFH